MVFGSFSFSWGLVPPQTKGAWQPGCFITPNHKTACYGGIFGPFFGQKYCNLSCCRFASKPNSDFMKNAQNHANCEVKPIFCKKQLEAKSSPIAFSICFSQSTHTLHVLCKINSFSVASHKTLYKSSQRPFFGASGPSKNPPWNSFFKSRPQEKKT